jgi:hypothetical protein
VLLIGLGMRVCSRGPGTAPSLRHPPFGSLNGRNCPQGRRAGLDFCEQDGDSIYRFQVLQVRQCTTN